MNQIKICMSTVRIILVNAIAVAFAFVARHSARASALTYGDPRDQSVLGPLVTTAAAENMDALIKDASENADLCQKKLRPGQIHHPRARY